MEAYRLGGALGRGTYAEVFRGWAADDPEGAPVRFAIKRVFPTPHTDGISSATIREVAILRKMEQLNHPNVLRIENVVFQPNINIILEFANGGTLANYSRAFNQNRIAVIRHAMHGVLNGVRFLHANDIIHRDLKPDNILVHFANSNLGEVNFQDAVIKISDYGLACYRGIGTTSVTTNVISSVYRPPELFLERSDYSFEVDMWSCGIILAELAGLLEVYRMDDSFCPLRLFGVTTPQQCPGIELLPKYQELAARFPHPTVTPKQIAPQLDGVLDGLELLQSLLDKNPYTRITSENAFQSAFITPLHR